jgi:hypothetical protein
VAHGGYEGRVFFFLKKKEAKKTFPVCTRARASSKRGKVFWFFFSKKNRLLAYCR